MRVSEDGGSKTVLLSDAAVFGLNPCPDGKTLLFTWIGHGGGRGVHIWRMDANGANPQQLSFGKLDFFPVCTPDSKEVFYTELNGNVMRVPVDGSHKPELVPGSVVPNTILGDPHGGLSPDGKLLAFVVTANTRGDAPAVQRIALLPLEQGAEAHIRFLDPNPRFHPGRHLHSTENR